MAARAGRASRPLRPAAPSGSQSVGCLLARQLSQRRRRCHLRCRQVPSGRSCSGCRRAAACGWAEGRRLGARPGPAAGLFRQVGGAVALGARWRPLL